jgi:hypothetical protein
MMKWYNVASFLLTKPIYLYCPPTGYLYLVCQPTDRLLYIRKPCISESRIIHKFVQYKLLKVEIEKLDFLIESIYVGAYMLLYTVFRVCLVRMYAHPAGVSSWVPNVRQPDYMISVSPAGAHKPYKGWRSIYLFRPNGDKSSSRDCTSASRYFCLVHELDPIDELTN